MSLLAGVLSTLTGALPKAVNRAIDAVLPDKLSEPEKEAIKTAATDAAHRHELEMTKEVVLAEAQFNLRLKDMEGTAKDLSALPIIGKIVIFIRGCMRPAFCVSTIYWDWKILSHAWEPPDRELFILINFLVLGFLFGERTLINVMPYIERWTKARNGGGS